MFRHSGSYMHEGRRDGLDTTTYMIFIRFLLLLLFVYLVVRTTARLLFRLLGIKVLSSKAGTRRPQSKMHEPSGAVDADYEVVESHITDEARRG